MKIKLGERIKEFRKRDGRKQEDLANALGITNQAVSRWETDICYPDVEILPSIANYFGVTIDELFGYQSERAKKVDGFFNKIQEMNRENNGKDVCIDECLQFARECLAEFPEEKKLIYALASALYNAGYVRHGEHHLTNEDGYDVFDVERHRTYPEWQEAIKLYEKALTMLEYGDIRNQAVCELIQLYVNTGETEKAINIISTMPDISCCREFLYLNSCDGQERARMYAETLLITVSRCVNLMISNIMTNKEHFSNETCVEIICNAISMYDLICTDGNYGIYNAELAHIYLYLSEHQWLAGNKDGAFAALDKSLDHAKKFESFCSRKEAVYTAPLLKLIKVETDKLNHSIVMDLPDDWPWWCVPDCSQVKAEMEVDPRWADWVKRTQKTCTNLSVSLGSNP